MPAEGLCLDERWIVGVQAALGLGLGAAFWRSSASATTGPTSTTPAATSRPEPDRSVSLHLLGIRHHGPGSARSVLAALDAIGPDTVLVELPADTASALGWIGEPGLVPPVAMLTYVAWLAWRITVTRRRVEEVS